MGGFFLLQILLIHIYVQNPQVVDKFHQKPAVFHHDVLLSRQEYSDWFRTLQFYTQRRRRQRVLRGG